MKYPRTYHLTFSPGCTNDDKKLEKNDYFLNTNLIVSEKLDGSNLCFTKNDCFARSHGSSPKHKSFDLAKSYHSQIGSQIPDNLFIFMEYTFAKHSIYYNSLDSYFHVFAIYNELTNNWLSWEDVKNISVNLGLITVPVLYEGKLSTEKSLIELSSNFMRQKSVYGQEIEGLVFSTTNEFSNDDFWKNKAKIVRANHVQTSEHWKDQVIIKNKLLS